jgi:hypothetical protein
MYIEKQREAELARRKGTTGRVIIQVVWLGLWVAAGYYLTNYLYSNELVTPNMIYNVGIPRAIPEEVFFWAIVLFIVFVSQIFLTMGFAVGSASGRRRPGEASARAANPDPLDQQFRNR